MSSFFSSSIRFSDSHRVGENLSIDIELSSKLESSLIQLLVIMILFPPLLQGFRLLLSALHLVDDSLGLS